MNKKEIYETIIKKELNKPFIYTINEIEKICTKSSITNISFNDAKDANYIYLEISDEEHYAYIQKLLEKYYDKYKIDYLIYNTWVNKKIKELDFNDHKYIEKENYYNRIMYIYSKTFNIKYIQFFIL